MAVLKKACRRFFSVTFFITALGCHLFWLYEFLHVKMVIKKEAIELVAIKGQLQLVQKEFNNKRSSIHMPEPMAAEPSEDLVKLVDLVSNNLESSQISQKDIKILKQNSDLHWKTPGLNLNLKTNFKALLKFLWLLSKRQEKIFIDHMQIQVQEENKLQVQINVRKGFGSLVSPISEVKL